MRCEAEGKQHLLLDQLVQLVKPDKLLDMQSFGWNFTQEVLYWISSTDSAFKCGMIHISTMYSRISLFVHQGLDTGVRMGLILPTGCQKLDA